MREFADYRINSSEEYRLKYLHEVDQNKKLTLVNEIQQSTIEDLRKQLANMEEKFAQNQKYTQVLEEKLETKTQTAKEFELKCVQSECEMVQVTKECKRQEERVEKLKKLNVDMLEEFDKAANNQVILDDKIKTLEVRVGEQSDDIKQKETANKKLTRQVKQLMDISKAAEKKADRATKTIQELSDHLQTT